MSDIKLCPECGVPRNISKHNTWLSNGTILEDNDPDHRVVFIENDSLRDAFAGVEKILGISIEHIIVESQRRSTYESVIRTLPVPLKLLVRYTATGLIARYLKKSGQVNGKGAIEITSFQRRKGKGDYIKLRIREPFSLAHFCGNFAGAIEGVDKREVNVTYEELAPDEYELTAHMSAHPRGLQERLQRKAPHYKPGDIELARCGTCGVPAVISDYEWLWDRGLIVNKKSGRRMIVVSTATQDAIMDELIAELGDAVTQAMVDAQRSLVASGFFSTDEIKGTDDFRTQFAYRGLGNIVEIDFDQDHLHVRIENPCLQPMVVGLIQGLYEGASGRQSNLEWEATADGDLVVDVSLKK
jgi:hypothetical protein